MGLNLTRLVLEELQCMPDRFSQQLNEDRMSMSSGEQWRKAEFDWDVQMVPFLGFGE